MKISKNSIFVSYTHTEDTKDIVLNFVNKLRMDGYNATCDQILSSEETAIDFGNMMRNSLIKSENVIVVLSKEYKEKADNNKGGTGDEFNYIANHIKNEPKKYILITLNKDHLDDFSDVLPSAFSMREVIEVDPDNPKQSKLYNKILDLPTTKISDVSEKIVLPDTYNADSSIQSIKNDIIDSEVDQLAAFDNPATLFDYRIKGAFPGTRGIVEINDSEQAIDRILHLLKKPLSSKRLVDPIWYFRGNSCLDIKNCSQLSGNKILMNVDELILDNIAAYIDPYGEYKRNFVYVKISPDQPTGLYDISIDLKKYPIDTEPYLDYHSEEFGVYKDLKITRQEYDDGAAVRDGRILETLDADLRVRYLTPYNFVICAKSHPFNSSMGDEVTGNCLHEMLMGRMKMEDLVNNMKKIPLNAW